MIKIERHRPERPGRRTEPRVNGRVHQMTCLQVLGADGAAQQRLLLTVLQIENGELPIFGRAGPDREQHASAARQHGRSPMRVWRRRRCGQRGDLSAVRRHSPQADVAAYAGDHDRAVVAPGSALRLAQLSCEGNDRFASDRHFLQVAAVEEWDPAAVGREERRSTGGDAGERHGVELVERAQHQPAAAMVDKISAVG